MKKYIFNLLTLILSCGFLSAQSVKLIPSAVFSAKIASSALTNVDFLVDSQPKTNFQAKTNTATYILEFTNAVRASYYKLTSADLNPINDPQQWILKGSIDGKKWITLDKRNKYKFYSRFQDQQFEIARSDSYRYYKLELKSASKSKLALADITFFEGKTPLADWRNFVYPRVNFVDKDTTVNGSKIYNRLIHNPSDFVREHSQKVVSILYFNDKDKIEDIQTLNYELRPDKGISAKGGDAPLIEIFYSADWVEKTALKKGDYDVLYETRGVLYHELTHGYQHSPKGCGEYRRGDEYFAFIEGVADAVRYEAGFFPITNRRVGGNWMDGYQTTGFFLQWLTTKDVDFIRKFNRSAIELDPWSFDAAMKHILGNDKTTQGLWDEYQEFLKKRI